MKKWTVDDQGTGEVIPLDGYYFEVRLYPDREKYLRAYKRFDMFDASHNMPPGFKRYESVAVTINERVLTISPDGTETESPRLGYILLNAKELDEEIISHESTHVALALWRKRHKGFVSLGRSDSWQSNLREEELALSQGRISVAVFAGCLHYGALAARRKPRSLHGKPQK